MVKKIYSKHYSPPPSQVFVKNLIERKLIIPLLAGLVFAAVVAGFTMLRQNNVNDNKNTSKSLVFTRQLIGKNQYVGEIKGVMKTALATEKNGGRITVSRGQNSLEFSIPIDDPTLNSQDVGILQATDVSFASKDKIISAKYNLLPNGIKEEIILNKIPQQNTLAMMMKTENLQVKLNPDNIPVFYDPSGEYQFHFERPFVKDGSGQVSYGVRYKFIDQNNKSPELFRNEGGKDTKREMLGGNLSLPSGQYTLNIEVDSEWLHDPSRVLPIIIDPTIVHDESSEFATGQFNRVQDTGSGSSPVLETYYQELPSDKYTVGLWHLNEASGNALDSSGNGNTGTPNGTTVVTGRDGFGNARSFNGTSDYIATSVDTAANQLFASTNVSWTVEAWFKHSGGAAGDQMIVGRGGGTGGSATFGLYIDSANALKTVLRGVQSVLFAGAADGKWHYAAVTWDGYNAVGYFDNNPGVLLSVGTAAVQTNNTYIGAQANGASLYFSGLIDEVRVSNAARSQEDIRFSALRRPYSIYSSDVLDLGKVYSWNSLSWTELGVTTADGETIKDTTGLVAQWNFNETSGTTATNDAGSCGASCNGTLTGFASTASQDQATGTGWTADNRRWGAGALMFDGTDDNVSAGTVADLKFTGDFSIEAWVKPSGSTVGQIVSNGAASDWMYLLGGSTVSSPICKIYQANSGSGYLQADGKTPITDGNWHYVVCTLSGTTLSVYIDGVLDATSSTTTGTRDVSSAGTFTIGKFTNTTSSYFAGDIDSFRAYSRPLTASEILSNYNASSIELQTRVGDTSSPDDGTWEAWRPTTSETQIDNFDSNTDSDGIDTVYLGDVGTNQTWIKKNNVIPSASDTSSTDGRIPIGTAGKGDSNYTFYPRVIKDGSTYKMWYGGYDGSNYRTFYASSPDGLTWTKNDNTIEAPSDTTGTNGRIPLGTAGKGDSTHALYSTVVKDGSTYKMWYGGHDGTTWRIYYATSSDGLTWTKYDNTIPTASDTSSTNGRIPLGTAGKGDVSGVIAPTVIKDGSIYKMWYSGSDGSNWRIFYATSSDGLTWTKYDNTTPSNSDNVSTNGRIPLGTSGVDTSHAYIPNVIKDGDVYKMWYGMHNGTNVRIGYAISRDGITWSKYQNTAPATSDTTGTFGRLPIGNSGRGDQTHAFGGSVIKDNGVYKMWYQGYLSPNYMIYHASMTPLPLAQQLDTNIKMEGTASEKITTGINKIDAGVAALWHLDETDGSGAYIKDISGNNLNGTPSGTTVADGIQGKARSFNGTGDYISMGDVTNFDGATSLTIQAWIKPNTLPDTSTQNAIVAKADYAAAGNAFFVRMHGTEGIRFAVRDSGGTQINCDTAVLPTAGVWTLVTAVLTDSDSCYVYYNGVQKVTASNTAFTSIQNTATVLKIGSSDYSTEGHFDGLIDEVIISKTERTAEEILESYRMGRGHYVNRTISSTDLSGKSTIPFYVAADRPGTYLQATVGESAYANYQPDVDTMGFWHLEEAVGSGSLIKDATVYGNSITSGSSTVVQGKIGNARSFNGTSDGILQSSGSNVNVTGDISVEAWINPSTLTGSNNVIVHKDSQYSLNIRTSDNFVSWADSSDWSYANFGFYDIGIRLNTWQHIIATKTGSTVKIYLNGVEKLSQSFGSSITGTSNVMAIGCYSSVSSCTSHYFPGLIDEVRISNVVRTPDEIRQTYEAGLRSHPITIDFAAKLDSGNLIGSSADLGFTVDATYYGLNSMGSNLYPGDKIIVRENYDGTEYIAQGTVTSVNESTGATTVASWDSGGTFPSSGYSVNASVFKWQREYWNITEPMDGHVNAVTNLSLRLLDGNEGRTVWIDDLSSGGDYLTTPSGSTITSSTGKRYFQYRVVQHSSDENVSASLTSATLDYVQNSPPNTPSLDSPTDTQTNRSLTPSLQTTTTDTNSDNLQYKIELCEDLAMTSNCQTFDQTSSQTGWSGQNADGNTTYTSGTQATYTVQAPLVAATTYYWRSYAIDPGGINTWSSTQGTPYSFTITTAPSAPLTPYAEGATNPTGVTDTTPEFSAVVSDPDGDSANYYRIQVNTQSDFLGTSMWDSTKQSMTTTANGVRSPDISYAGTAIPLDGAGTTYYWRIKFWDVNGAEGSYTTAQSFTMNVTPGTPTLDAPTDTATSQSVQASLKTTATDTNSDNLKYKIELCTNATMTLNCQTFDQTISQTGWSGQNADTNTTYTSGTQATYNIQSALSPATTYYWRSYAIDPSGSNTWSATQGTPYSFTTTSTDYPTQCRIEKSVNNNSLIVKWNDNSTNEINYEIQKNTDGGGFSLLQTLAANSISHQDNSVSNGHTYQYRVAAIFSGPQYSQWCITSTVSLGLGKLHLEGVNLE